MTGTTAPVADTTYGGPDNKYVGVKPAATAPYGSQQTGVVGSGAGGGFSEMDAGQPGSAQNPYSTHDPNPYAEIHHGGYPHSGPETGYAR